METHSRSIAKAVSWRIIGFVVTTLLVFAFTGDLVVSGGVGLTETLSKIGLFYVHERIWNATNLGRVKQK